MVKIIQRDNSILRQNAKEVPVKDIGKPETKQVISDMKKALASQDDGVALAAPQIGQPLAIFIISGKTEGMIKGIDPDEEALPDSVFINPKITKLSKDKKEVDEGCLSVRWLYGKVKRAEKATVEAYDEHGNKFSRGASGLIAQIFQHETDHLQGVLFTDKATEVQDLPPDDTQSSTKA